VPEILASFAKAMLAVSEARKEPMFEVWSPNSEVRILKSEVWTLKLKSLHGFRKNESSDTL
jgi:hypothetical protein